MKINDELLNKLSNLAKLEFEGEEREEIKSDLNKMLAFMDELQKVNTDNVEPLIYMTNETNVMRADEVQETLAQQEALKNAPAKNSDYFKVPKVLNK